MDDDDYPQQKPDCDECRAPYGVPHRDGCTGQFWQDTVGGPRRSRQEAEYGRVYVSTDAWHEFHDGPWAGQRFQIDTSPDGYRHLVAHRSEPGVGEWVPADAWPGRSRYVRTGSDGETTVMTWSQA